MALRAVLFDAYGTLFDVHSVTALADEIVPGHGAGLSQLWREKQIEYTRLVSMSGRWQPFGELTRAALRYAAERLALTLDAAGEQRLMAAYLALQPFDENRGVLIELQSRGIPVGILSNGDAEMLTPLVLHAEMTGLLQHVISVAPSRRYKTDPAAYALGSDALGLPASDILFVSSNGWDAIGATWFGYTTLWVNRSGQPLDPLGAEPTHRGTTLADLLPLLS